MSVLGTDGFQHTSSIAWADIALALAIRRHLVAPTSISIVVTKRIRVVRPVAVRVVVPAVLVPS